MQELRKEILSFSHSLVVDVIRKVEALGCHDFPIEEVSLIILKDHLTNVGNP